MGSRPNALLAIWIRAGPPCPPPPGWCRWPSKIQPISASASPASARRFTSVSDFWADGLTIVWRRSRFCWNMQIGASFCWEMTISPSSPLQNAALPLNQECGYRFTRWPPVAAFLRRDYAGPLTGYPWWPGGKSALPTKPQRPILPRISNQIRQSQSCPGADYTRSCARFSESTPPAQPADLAPLYALFPSAGYSR